MRRFKQMSIGLFLGLVVLVGALGLLPAVDRAEVVQAAPVQAVDIDDETHEAPRPEYLFLLAPDDLVPMQAGEDGTRDTITPTTITDSSITQTLAAASGDGHKFKNNGREIVVVKNGYTATVTMTIVTGGSVGGHPIDDVTVGLTAGTTKMAGPFRTGIFNQPSGDDAGRVYLNWNAAVTGSVASSVTLAVYTVPPL